MRIVVSLLLLIFTVVFAGSAQEDDMIYVDGDNRFQMPIPADWTNLSTPQLAQFVNPDETATLFALAVEAADVQAGISAALAIIDADFAAQPVQSSEVPLGDVAWTQNIYALPDGNLVAALGRMADGITYAIVLRAPQAVLVAETPVLNQTLIGHALMGEISLADARPDYVDYEAFTEEEITITSGDVQLPGTLALPTGTGSFPAVVIVHGSGPQNRDGTLGVLNVYRDIAQGLASQGIASLRYDKRTLVAPEGTATIDDELTDDAIAAANLLRERDDIDTERIYVIGHSLGGNLAPRIAQQDGNLAGIVLMAGSPRPFDVLLQDQIDYLLSLDANTNVAGLDVLAERIREVREGAAAADVFNGDEMQITYWESLLAYDAAATAQALELPMLILQGERDYQVTMADFSRWQDILAERENVTFKSYPDLMHAFAAVGDLERLSVPADYALAGFVDERVINDIAAWING